MVQLAISVLSAVALLLVRRHRQRRLPAQAVIVYPRESTSIAQDGAVRSHQSADLTVSRADLQRLWNATNLENLARTYWRFLSRVFLGLIRVVYGENERSVVLFGRPLTLLRFEAPQYDIRPDYGSVRWRIRDGLLVARGGRGCGYLAIEVRRQREDSDLPEIEDSDLAGTETERVRIDIEVSNFYPAIAAGFSMPVYHATQSSVHVLVTHAFLRSLAKLNLAQSKVGRLAGLRMTDPQADGRGWGQSKSQPLSRSVRP